MAAVPHWSSQNNHDFDFGPCQVGRDTRIIQWTLSTTHLTSSEQFASCHLAMCRVYWQHQSPSPNNSENRSPGTHTTNHVYSLTFGLSKYKYTHSQICIHIHMSYVLFVVSLLVYSTYLYLYIYICIPIFIYREIDR